MNIGQAKQQILNSVRAYLACDERGSWRIPPRMQRPIVVFGPPGVGKTAVVSQVAQELGINFVSYSITHHTRQSALGLPYITSEEFDGQEYRVSDYTMSEIIAAVHRARRASGVDHGILFLDEVNCVSKTLAPAMLQFLQFKTFGMHALPQGWVIVCAGNPPEYNRSAREFDSAMLDRVKRIDVEPDLGVWQDYAAASGVHPAVTTFLEAKPALFYRVRSNVHAPQLVTARGWEDLARVLAAYEDEELAVDVHLVGQYLQDEQVASEFFAYYQLFCKYRDSYRIDAVLAGQADDELVARASSAPFDERVALVGMLLDAVLDRIHDAQARQEGLKSARKDLQGLGDAGGEGEAGGPSRPQSEGENEGESEDEAARLAQALRKRIDVLDALIGSRGAQQASSVQREAAEAEHRLALLGVVQAVEEARGQADAPAPFEAAKAAFNYMVDSHEELARSSMVALDNAFAFLDDAFGNQSQEALIMTTRLSADPALVSAVVEHGSQQYLWHNKALLLSERNIELLREVEQLQAAGAGATTAATAATEAVVDGAGETTQAVEVSDGEGE